PGPAPGRRAGRMRHRARARRRARPRTPARRPPVRRVVRRSGELDRKRAAGLHGRAVRLLAARTPRRGHRSAHRAARRMNGPHRGPDRRDARRHHPTQTRGTSMIHLENVEKSWPLAGGRTWVLRNINLDIAEGEFVSIMGPSGAGKSSLLNVLGLMDHDWQGEYVLDEVAVGKLAPKQRQALQRDKIGFIFQHYHLIDELSVRENLDLPLQYRDVPAKERAARVADMLDRFQIVGKKDLYPNQLSGGQ